ncbi:MAG: hypothetical protein H7096_06270 [Flavobacterium sp.]|nr:hypothetical protein [Pedobacter sp.]
MKKPVKLILVLVLFLPLVTFSQSLPTTMHVVEDAYRRAQMEGKLDSSVSFTIRPLIPSKAFKTDSSHLELSKWIDYTGIKSENNKFGIGLLPLTWNQQYNSTVPYGWNDGAMIPSRGYQTLVTGGFYAKAGPLSIQLKPEFIFAENKEFEGDSRNLNLGAVDLPLRFGEGSYSNQTWGQSSIKLNLGPVSAGISNENLWLGPAKRNSLLMSQNAQGFKHFTIHSNKPIRSYIGSFEFQIIGGKLLNSGFRGFPAIPKDTGWRYLSVVSVNYQPKWVPGLFFGLNRSFQSYGSKLKGFKDYFPFLAPFEKSKDQANSSGSDEKDQIVSFHSRWLFPKSHAEIYFEYGLNDHSYNLRDFIMSPEHSRAYTFGFGKMIPFKSREGQFLQFNAEITQLSQSADRLVRQAYAWYTHFQILQGYTHKGEVLGAGTGPGGNLQSADLRWVKGIKSIGFQFERFVHNNDFYDAAISDLDGQSRRWVDFGFAALGTWDFNHLLLNVKLQGIQSLNYQWQLKNYTPGTYYIPENDLFNFHGEVGITYRF